MHIHIRIQKMFALWIFCCFLSPAKGMMLCEGPVAHVAALEKGVRKFEEVVLLSRSPYEHPLLRQMASNNPEVARASLKKYLDPQAPENQNGRWEKIAANIRLHLEENLNSSRKKALAAEARAGHAKNKQAANAEALQKEADLRWNNAIADFTTMEHLKVHVEMLKRNIDNFAKEHGLTLEETTVAKQKLEALVWFHDQGKMSEARRSDDPMMVFLRSLVEPMKDYDAVPFLNLPFLTNVGPHEFFSVTEGETQTVGGPHWGMNEKEFRDMARLSNGHNFTGIPVQPKTENAAWPKLIWRRMIEALKRYDRNLPDDHDLQPRPGFIDSIANYEKPSHQINPITRMLVESDRTESLFSGPAKFATEGGGKPSIASLFVNNGKDVAAQLLVLKEDYENRKAPVPPSLLDGIARAKQLQELGEKISAFNASKGNKDPNVILLPGTNGEVYTLTMVGGNVRQTIVTGPDGKPFSFPQSERSQRLQEFTGRTTPAAYQLMDLINELYNGQTIAGAPFQGGL